MNTAANYDLKIKKRIQLVHIAANELGLLDPKRHETDPEDEYHLILRRWNRQNTRQPVTSSLQMSYQQLGELLDFFKALGFKLKQQGAGSRGYGPGASSAASAPPREKSPSWKKYESSIAGLKQEVCDLARERWCQGSGSSSQGGEWELPLNNFCQRFGVKRWQWLDVSHAKAVKEALVRMQNAQGNSNTAESRAHSVKDLNPMPHAPCASSDLEVPF